MISREWRAQNRRDLRDEFVGYVQRTGVAECRALEGNSTFGVAVRDLGDARSEIVTSSVWRSEDDIRAFAGPDTTLAVYVPEDDEYLLSRPEWVTHCHHSGFEALSDGQDNP